MAEEQKNDNRIIITVNQIIIVQEKEAEKENYNKEIFGFISGLAILLIDKMIG